MKNKSLLGQILSKFSEDGDSPPATSREYIAEALEARILYSAAPVEMPETVVAEEAPANVEGENQGGFESIDSFASAAGDQPAAASESTATATAPGEGLTLSTLDDLSPEEIEMLATAAIERWKESGLTEEQLEVLEAIEISVIDIDGLALGYADGTDIFLDEDAAGLGWWVDSTPLDDVEFFADEDGLMKAIDEAARSRMDLLTVLVHEMGHVIGLEDVYDNNRTVMYGSAQAGVRLLPTDGLAVDAVPGSVEGRAFAAFNPNVFTDDALNALNDATEFTLREAIRAANASGVADTIDLAAGTYELGTDVSTQNAGANAGVTEGTGENAALTGDLDITNSGTLTIRGQGKGVTIIDGNELDRVFHIHSGANVIFENLTITGGFVDEANGGGIYHNGGTLTLNNVEIIDNEVQDTVDNNTHALGGGIYNNSRDIIATDSDLKNNSATRNGGNEVAGGGGLFSSGGGADTTWTGGEISGNTAREGGGIYMWSNGADLILDGVNVTGNTSNVGGGFRVNDLSNTVLRNNTQIDGNRSNGSGGGFSAYTGATVTFESGSDLVNNSAQNSGAGFYAATLSTINMNDGSAMLIQGNEVEDSGGVIRGAGGGFYATEGSQVNLGNVTISDNKADEGAGFYTLRRDTTVTGTNVTIEDNDADVRGGGFRNAQEGSIVNLTDSVIQNNTAATEHGGGFYTNGTVLLHNTGIIGNSNGTDTGDHGGGFMSNLGIVTITGTSPIQDNTTTGSGGGFWNRGGEVTITGAAGTPNLIQNNQSGVHGAGFWSSDGATTTLTNVDFVNNTLPTNRVGAGFYATSGSQVTLDTVNISNHTANEGGAFYISDSGTAVTGTNVTLDDNYAYTRGGAFRVAHTEASVYLTDSSISGNTAEREHGGGFYNNGTVTLINTAVTDNHALDADASAVNLNNGAGSGINARRDSYGGGFYNGGGTVNMTGGQVSLNDTYGHGGGFYNTGGVVNMTGTVIDQNAVLRGVEMGLASNQNRHGGGFWNAGDSVANLTDVTISDNTLGLDTNGNVRGAGGGFGNADGSTVNIDGASSIVRNQGEDGGGFYNTSTGSTVNITGTAAAAVVIGGSAADANVARTRGGGFRSTGNTIVNLDYVDISHNIAQGERGGGVYADGAQISGSNVTITNNEAIDTGGSRQGGGLFLSGNGATSLTDSLISENFTNHDGGGFYLESGTIDLLRTDVVDNYANASGGGFFTTGNGEVTLTDSSVSDNHARSHAGGFWTSSDSKVTATRTHIDGNLAGYEQDGVTQRESGAIGADLRGGGFWASERGEVTLIDSTLDNNEAARYGGGGNMEHESKLTLIRSTIAGNVADNHGGGLRIATNVHVDAVNSTFSDNYAGFSRAENAGAIVASATNAVGGGFWSQSGGNVVDLNHVTITDNKVSRGGVDGGGGYYRSSGTITIENSIIYGNIADFDTPGGEDASDIRGNGILVGANIIGVQGNGTLSGDIGNRIGTNPADDPGLLPLDQYGGFGRTHAIASTSTAESLAINSTVATDQTGAGRLTPTIDVGAYEVAPVDTTLLLTEFEVPETGISGEAVDISALATSTGPGPVTYNWVVTDSTGATVATPAAGSPSSFTFNTTPDDPIQTLTVQVTATDTTTGQVVISTKEVTVVDPQACPDHTTTGVTVLTVNNTAGNTLRDHIATANTSPGNYVIVFDASVDFSTTGVSTFTIADATTDNNTAAATNDDGNANGDLDINKTGANAGFISIVGNGAAETIIDGGGLDRVFHVLSGSTIFMSNLTITGGETTADSHGAGIRNEGGTIVMKNVDVTGNNAIRGANNDDDGGGIYTSSSGVNSGRIFMTNGSVSNNNAEDIGGGIYMSGTNVGESMLFLDGTTIDGNVASSLNANIDDQRGGGFYITDDGNRIVFRDVTVSDNLTNGRHRADGGGGAIAGSNLKVEITGGSFIRNQAGSDAHTGGTHDSDGGGIWIAGSNNEITFTDVDFGGELAGGAGAAGIGTARVDGNIAEDDGGGAYIEGRFNNITFIDTSFIGNQANDNAGGFFIANDTENVTFRQTVANGVQIRNNFALTAHAGGFWNHGNLTMIGASDDPIEITHNEADIRTTNNNDRRGGGFWTGDNGTTNLVDVRIEENQANRHGAGFWNSGGATTNISSSDAGVFQSTISNNRTLDTNDGDGGGFYNTSAGSTVNLTDVVIDGNVTTDDGGGFYQSSNGSITNLTNVDITNNQSQDDGGGFYNASNGSIVNMNAVTIDTPMSRSPNTAAVSVTTESWMARV